LTIFSIHFATHLINKSEFSWKTRNCLGDPKLLNGSVYIIYNTCYIFIIYIIYLYIIYLCVIYLNIYLYIIYI